MLLREITKNSILRKALSLISEDYPYRGQKEFVDGDYRYSNKYVGEIDNLANIKYDGEYSCFKTDSGSNITAGAIQKRSSFLLLFCIVLRSKGEFEQSASRRKERVLSRFSGSGEKGSVVKALGEL